MPMLSAADVADLRSIFVDAQTDTSLVLHRFNSGSGEYDSIPAQDVQVSYASRQPEGGGLVSTERSMAPVTFYREAPFNVQVGDSFSLDNHKGGVINRVYTDPVLGVIVAEAGIDVGVA